MEWRSDGDISEQHGMKAADRMRVQRLSVDLQFDFFFCFTWARPWEDTVRDFDKRVGERIKRRIKIGGRRRLSDGVDG